MCGFIVQLVEHRTGIAEVTGSNPVEALIFFRLLLSSITALALVEVTNSTSAHLDCLHTVTNRYFPVLIGPQKSTATSFQGSLGMGVMRNGSLSCDMLTTWHGWQCWMCSSVILSSPGNHTLVRRYSLVLVLPWWPLCASLTTLSRRALGTTIRGPRTTNPPTTANSVKMASGPEFSLLLP